jgi:branched-chain amino acid aminotransferase
MYYNKNTIVFLNGKFVNVKETLTDSYSQTLHYGYGAFEGIRAYATANGTLIFKAKEHFQRLQFSTEKLGISFNMNIPKLMEETYKLLELNNLFDAYIRPIIIAEPKMSLLKPDKVSLMIMAWEWGTLLGNNLLDVCTSSYCRPHPKSLHVNAKINGHYVNSILAANDAKSKGYDEAILLDVNGFLAEAPGANLFFEKDNELFTPETGNILPGITRSTLLSLAVKLNIKVNEGKYLPSDMSSADSAFLCGTAAEVIGIKKFDNYIFPLDREKSIGKKLQSAYKNLVLEKN